MKIGKNFHIVSNLPWRHRAWEAQIGPVWWYWCRYFLHVYRVHKEHGEDGENERIVTLDMPKAHHVVIAVYWTVVVTGVLFALWVGITKSTCARYTEYVPPDMHQACERGY